MAVRLRIAASGATAGTIREIALGVEGSDAQALFVSGRRAGEDANDPFVVLGAASSFTSRLGLGCLPSLVEERAPSMLAKTLASLDLLSGGRAIACVTSGFAGSVDPVGSLVEAVVVLRLMLEVAGPTFHGEHFSLTRAWNEPRVPRQRPMPIGVAIERSSAADDAASRQAAQIVVALAEHVDFLVVDWLPDTAKPASGAIPVLAVVPAAPGSEVEAAATSAFRAGCAGVVLDFPEIPRRSALVEALTAARRASDRLAAPSG